MIKSIVIKFDADADVYYTASSDIPGFALESESLETLINRCKPAALELLELNGETTDASITLRFTYDCKLL